MDPKEVLEGEESLINLYAKCEALDTVYSGRLIVTTYQIVFIPEDFITNKKRHTINNCFKIPHGMLSKYDLIIS